MVICCALVSIWNKLKSCLEILKLMRLALFNSSSLFFLFCLSKKIIFEKDEM